MNRAFACFVAAALTVSLPVFADDFATDFADGAQAYDGGNIGQALKAWNRAAAAGHTGAMTALANLYLYGERVERNPARAAAWYRKAAEQERKKLEAELQQRIAKAGHEDALQSRSVFPPREPAPHAR